LSALIFLFIYSCSVSKDILKSDYQAQIIEKIRILLKVFEDTFQPRMRFSYLFWVWFNEWI